MFKTLLRSCMDGKTLTETEAEKMMDLIMSGEATPSQIASLITIMRLRGETVDEITGFARSMRAHSLQIPTKDLHVLDTCGTGGDSLGTFNISTATALVLASLGVPIAKHGNRAVSSKSGSADVLEKLRIPIQNTPEEAKKSLERLSLCFMFAPIYHQSMRYAAVPRQEIGFRTIFNVLGPLTNPAQAKHQLIGVYNKDFAEKMAEAIRRLGTKKTLVVTGGEGLDECSITTETTIIEVKGNDLHQYTITPEEVGLKRGILEEIQVKTPSESAAVIEAVLAGKGNESATGIVTLNTAAALYASERVPTIKAGVELVQNEIQSGSVYKHFQKLRTENMEEEQHA